MTECFEFEGKTVAKAIQKAAQKLNVAAEALQHEVLSFGSSGIFGIVGARKARIRVRHPKIGNAVSEEAGPETVRDNPGDAKETVSEIGAPLSESPSQGELEERGREAIERIVEAITADAAIRVSRDHDSAVRYIVEGGNLGLIIGKKGQTLEAIHYLVEKIVNKNSQKRIRIDIDVGGYLLNRQQNLSQLALRLAEKARSTGKPTTVGQMNAYDRRIVHMALRDDPSVRTQSVGEGAIRKLIIFPKRRSEKEGPRTRRNGQSGSAGRGRPQSTP